MNTLSFASFIVGGLVGTIGTSLAAFAGAAFIGLMLNLASTGTRTGVVQAIRVYIVLFRSLPEILCVFIAYYGFDILLSWMTGKFDLAPVTISPFVAVTTALAIQFGAYCAEIFGDARRSVHPGLIEAAAALGMTETRVALRVTIPLMVRAAIPGLGNLFLVILKVSALASVIGLEEVTRRAKIVAGATREPFAAYAIAALCFLAVAALATLVLHRLHGRFHDAARGA
ncbi:ABC transporter permease subunit [Paraburkholderia sp. UYCP14C]|uniref:ABC transporter permease subunit n=1 Tax=Paraburkholderia sp. UYCP14C TaxID=2511130 RepID=UPI001020F0F3|nr:ABC transporter permease subunit [Paraburkholderia sp. UYCP14C]RZF24212.1 ABC transporter permease subunit [Paraburkholderia sp. UYCP14C]